MYFLNLHFAQQRRAPFTAPFPAAIGFAHELADWPYPATYPPLGVSWRAHGRHAAPLKG